MDIEIKNALDKIFEELSDIQDELNEKDYQILHITQELDEIKSRL
jgi:hypothetical protein